MARDWLNQWEDERDSFEAEIIAYRPDPILADLSKFTIGEIKLAMNRLQDELNKRLNKR